MLANCETVEPAVERKSYPWMLAGTAFDYRARLFFEPAFNFENTMALGRSRLGMTAPKECANTSKFLSYAGLELTAEQRADDDYLARLCVIAAYLEGVHRSGKVGDWLLEAEKMTPEELLEVIPDPLVSDVTQMAKKLECTFSVQMPKRIVSNPTLGRASLNIGADGDLILDDCLIEIKSAVNAEVSQAMLHQLVCYILLDREDLFGIRKAGLYMARQGALSVWPIPELLMLLGAPNTDIGALRILFEEAAHQL